MIWEVGWAGSRRREDGGGGRGWGSCRRPFVSLVVDRHRMRCVLPFNTVANPRAARRTWATAARALVL